MKRIKYFFQNDKSEPNDEELKNEETVKEEHNQEMSSKPRRQGESSSSDEEEGEIKKLKLRQKKRDLKRQKMHKTDDETNSD